MGNTETQDTVVRLTEFEEAVLWRLKSKDRGIPEHVLVTQGYPDGIPGRTARYRRHALDRLSRSGYLMLAQGTSGTLCRITPKGVDILHKLRQLSRRG